MQKKKEEEFVFFIIVKWLYFLKMTLGFNPYLLLFAN